MARRSSHNHNIPTVSLKSNYKIDGKIEITGDLYVNGKPVTSGGNSYEAGNGIVIDGGEITINDTYIKNIIASVDRDVNEAIHIIDAKIETINSQINNEVTGLEALSEKIYVLEDEIKTLKTLPKFSVKVEQELPKDLEEGVIYLIPTESGGEYEEYISYKNSDGIIVAESIGSKINLEDFYTAEQVDKKIEEKSAEIKEYADGIIEKDIENENSLIKTTIEASVDKLTQRVVSIEERLNDLGIPEEDKEDALQYGEEYATFAELNNNKASLKENTIYRVTDKNTIEEYILKDGKIEQISGNFNNQITEDMLDENGVSPMKNTIVNNEIAYNMPELVIGDYMFSGCDNLYRFVSDTPCLTSGVEMFKGCINLESFCGVLSSLENGTDMFSGCILDLDSILNIVDSINDSVSGDATITIGYNDGVVGEKIIGDFEEELNEKGWTVIWEKKSLYR